MLFNGSLNVGKGEHQSPRRQPRRRAERADAHGHTRVWETLPSNQLDLALFLEADRMRSLRLDQARTRRSSANTVLAERQQRVDNQPYGRVLDTLYQTAYDIAPYKKDYVGTDEGLRAVTVQEVNDFFRIFYAPNNAVLTVVGDFKQRDARAKIKNYFEHIPGAAAGAGNRPQRAGADRASDAQQMQDPFATAPRTYIAYKLEAGTGKEIGGGGRAAAPCYPKVRHPGSTRRLIRELEIIDSLGGSIDPRKGRGLMALVLVHASGRDEAAVLKAYDEVVARIQADGISDAEVARVRTRLLLARTIEMQETAKRATLLGEFETRFGDADLLNQARRVAARRSPPATCAKRAQRYMDPSRRTIVSVVRGGHTGVQVRHLALFVSAGEVGAVEPGANLQGPDSRLAPLHPRDDAAKRLDAADRPTTRACRSSSARFEIRGAGPIYAPAGNPALPLLAAAMLSKGTPSRSSLQIAEQFDTLGVSVTIGPAADPGTIVVLATGLSETFEDWFPAVSDVVRNASFPADELTSIKRRIVSDWQMRRSQPLAQAGELFDAAHLWSREQDGSVGCGGRRRDQRTASRLACSSATRRRTSSSRLSARWTAMTSSRLCEDSAGRVGAWRVHSSGTTDRAPGQGQGNDRGSPRIGADQPCSRCAGGRSRPSRSVAAGCCQPRPRRIGSIATVHETSRRDGPDLRGRQRAAGACVWRRLARIGRYHLGARR